MRARRIAVLRAQGRRRLHILLGVACLMLLAAGAWALTESTMLDVDRIVIDGADPRRESQVLRSSGLEIGTAMAFLGAQEAESSIESLPWVSSARVRRDWPGTVHIEVQARVPVAVVPASLGRHAVLDANAYVIEWLSANDGDRRHLDARPPTDQLSPTGSVDSAPVGANSALYEAPAGAADRLLLKRLPLISAPFVGGLGEIHTQADGGLAVLAAMPDDLRAWVQSIEVNSAGDRIALRLSGGAVAMINEPVMLDDKISALRAVLAGTELECITEIDLTMPDLTTITRHDSCAP